MEHIPLTIAKWLSWPFIKSLLFEMKEWLCQKICKCDIQKELSFILLRKKNGTISGYTVDNSRSGIIKVKRIIQQGNRVIISPFPTIYNLFPEDVILQLNNIAERIEIKQPSSSASP